MKFYPMTDMHKAESNCAEIVKKMAAAITNDALQVLFVSTQKNNLELCTKYAIKEWVSWSSVLMYDELRWLVEHSKSWAAAKQRVFLVHLYLQTCLFVSS